MTTKDGTPRVFGDGDLTFVLGQNGMTRVYVGQQQIGLVQQLKIDAYADQARPIVEIKFPTRADVSAELDATIEGYTRLLAPFSWVRVLR